MTIYIKDIRTAKNISIRELSKLSGISKSHISNIENGVKDPSLSVICKIAQALEVEPAQLFSCYSE